MTEHVRAQAQRDVPGYVPLVFTDAEWERIRSALEWDDDKVAMEAYRKLQTFMDPEILHAGIDTHRLGYENADRERAFAEEWQRQNERRSWINHGRGILQDLMYVEQANEHFGMGAPYRGHFATIITQRDATIVSTVIQWLGTNIGWCFLENVLRKCGYRLVREGK